MLCIAGDILVFLTGQAEIEKAIARINEGVASQPEGSCGPLLALPLYAALPPEMQARAHVEMCGYCFSRCLTATASDLHHSMSCVLLCWLCWM